MNAALVISGVESLSLQSASNKRPKPLKKQILISSAIHFQTFSDLSFDRGDTIYNGRDTHLSLGYANVGRKN